MRPEGKKNIRRNTSAILRVKKRSRDGSFDDRATKSVPVRVQDTKLNVAVGQNHIDRLWEIVLDFSVRVVPQERLPQD